MSDTKIVFTGTVGAGKTQAIEALSEIEIVSTDVKASDDVKNMKETTTIAMDYGEMTLDNGDVLALYGTPGQKRFSYMWDILAQGALGIVIMVDDSRRDPVADLSIYLENFKSHIDETTAVFGITHLDNDRKSGMQKYYDFFTKNNIQYPVMPVDARKKDEVTALITAMAAMVEVA